MKRKMAAGSTSQMTTIFIRDTSTTDSRAGLTGLTYASSGLTWYYRRTGAASATSVTLADATLGSYMSGGFKEVDATNMPGQYEIGIPDAALAASAEQVWMQLRGATNMEDLPIEIELDAVDYQDGVRGGMTALPNAAAGAENGLPTIDANQRVAAHVEAMDADTITAAAIAADAGAEIAAQVETAIVNEGDATAVLQAIADQIAADWVAGDASPVAIAAAVRTNLATELGRIDAAVSSRATAAAILTTALTESYAAKGADPTLSQAVLAVLQTLHDFAISGTTLTVKQLDGTTPALTLLLNDADNPSSAARAT